MKKINTNLNYIESIKKRKKFSILNSQLLILLLALLALASCSKEKDPTPPPPDPHAAFKADATPRWENGATITKNEESYNTFLIDADGALFESAKYKTGYSTDTGSNYEFIEFSGAPAVGKPSSPSIRKPAGSTELYSLEIVKIDGAKLWIVFKETASSTERKVVQ